MRKTITAIEKILYAKKTMESFPKTHIKACEEYREIIKEISKIKELWKILESLLNHVPKRTT